MRFVPGVMFSIVVFFHQLLQVYVRAPSADDQAHPPPKARSEGRNDQRNFLIECNAIILPLFDNAFRVFNPHRTGCRQQALIMFQSLMQRKVIL